MYMPLPGETPFSVEVAEPFVIVKEGGVLQLRGMIVMSGMGLKLHGSDMVAAARIDAVPPIDTVTELGLV
jgi:hypothetical protein